MPKNNQTKQVAQTEEEVAIAALMDGEVEIPPVLSAEEQEAIVAHIENAAGFPIADAPRDGRTILVTEDYENWFAAVWHGARKFNFVDRRWEDASHWVQPAVVDTGRMHVDGEPLGFEPVAWREL